MTTSVEEDKKTKYQANEGRMLFYGIY